jgi:hypothetical protein
MMLCAMLFAFAAQAQFTHPMLFEINSPSGIAGSYNYGPQSGAGWGITALPTPTVTGQLVWGQDITPDSLVCDTITNDYSGKIVMVRRGVCNFSQKMLNVQRAGAIGCVICNNQGTVDIINMAAGTFGAQVTIPAVSIGLNDCAAIAAIIDAGGTVNASFRKPYISEGLGFFAVETPQAQIYPHDSIMSVDITNAGSSNATNITVSLDITEPNGNVVTLTETLAALNVDSTSTVTFNSRYTPADTGTYTQVFKSSLSASDTIVKTFNIGENRFRVDRESNYSWGTITDANYATAQFKVSLGSTYLTGANGAVAKSVTYAMGDNLSRFLGKQLVLEIRKYPNVLTTATAVIDSFPIVAVGVDTIDVTDTAAYTLNTKTLLDVNTLEDSTLLDAYTQYLVVVKYVRAVGDTLSVAPRFAFSGDESFISYGTVVNSDALYLGGFGGINAVIRLNTNDVITAGPTAVQNILTQSQFNLFPNPAKDLLNVDLNLSETAENATVTMFDINGRIIEQHNYSNVKQQNIQFNVANLSAGFYFVRIQSELGVQTKEFIKK